MADDAADTLVVRYADADYDVRAFARRHPGGRRLLEAAAGTDITAHMAGETAGVDGRRHAHSAAARAILAQYALARPAAHVDRWGVDWRRPMIAQVGALRDDYWQWIHTPVDGHMRLVESDVWEWFTRNTWRTVPAVWLPVAAVLLAWAVAVSECWATTATLFGVGMALWTLTEYALHRCVFHRRPDTRSEWQITAHFIMHGIHHKTPMDPERLVFPPLVALPVIVAIAVFYTCALPWTHALPVMAGKLTGYVVYDVQHYYLHHGHPQAHTYWAVRKEYHHEHHYRHAHRGYGISTRMWDSVFGT